MTQAGEGTMREMEGGRGNARQAGAETEGRMPERTKKWKLGLGSETTTKSPANNQQRAGSSLELAFLELLNQRWGQGRQKEEIDGLKGMRE